MIPKSLLIIFISFYFVACSSVPRFTSNSTDNRSSERYKGSNDESSKSSLRNAALKTYFGVASYYAEKYNGNSTSNGEIYNMNDMTAASNDLPFNTMVRVTNLDNQKSVVLRINDRGPFVKNRIIDVSKRAAEELGMIPSGTAKVRIDVIKLGK